MESTRTREPISNAITSSMSSDNNNSSSQNRSMTSKPNSSGNNNITTPPMSISTQQILIDEGTIDCLSLPAKQTASSSHLSHPKSFKNLNIYNDDKNVGSLKLDEDDEEEEDEIDQLRIDDEDDEEIETITPTIITNKSLLSSADSMTKVNSNHSSSILDTLISSTNGPSFSMTSTVTTTPIPASNTTASPSMMLLNNNNYPHNFPYLSSTIANSPSKGGFLDRLFTFSPNATGANQVIGALKPAPTASYQDRVSLFTSTPPKTEVISSPSGSNQSLGFNSHPTNSLFSNDESPNFSHIWLNQHFKPSSNEVLGNTATTTNILSTSNVHNNNILNRQLPAHTVVNEHTGLMDTLYSNQIHATSPHSHKQLRNNSLIPSGIQKHTINHAELRRAREKTKNNLKHYLNESTLINNGPIGKKQTSTPLTALPNSTSPSKTSTSPSEEPMDYQIGNNNNNTKLPSPESEVPLKQKLKMRSYKIL